MERLFQLEFDKVFYLNVYLNEQAYLIFKRSFAPLSGTGQGYVNIRVDLHLISCSRF